MLTTVRVKEAQKTFEGAELGALLNEDPWQTQEFASVLGVTRQSISKRFHDLGMIQK